MWQWPVEGQVITPYRNGADPYAGGQHRGIDIAAPVGTPVVAAAGGTVTFAGTAGSSGLTVAVRTGDGFDTSYLHLSAIRVRAGQPVAAGAELGAVGTSGRRSAAEPHLHFGVREAGSRFAYRDPLDFLPPPPAAGPAPTGVPLPVVVPAAPRVEPVAVTPAAPVEPLAAPLAPAGGPLALAPGPVAALVGPPAAVAAPRGPSLHAAGLAAAGGHGLAGSSPRAAAGPPRPSQVAPSRRGSAAGRRAARPHAAHDPVNGRHARPSAAHVPAAGPAAALGSSRASAAVHADGTPTAPRRPAQPGGGVDLGWLAACVGLVAAALLLGRPRATAGSLRRALALSPPIVRSPKADRS
jgi:hypothetical protein